MRIKFAFCILAVLSIAAVVQGHDVGLPACGEAQLTQASALFGGYYDLIEAGPTADFTAEELVAYSEALFVWRDALWESVPLCEEASHAAMFLESSASFFVSTYFFELAGAPSYADPTAERASASDAQANLLELLADAPPAAGESAEEFSLPTCTDSDRDTLKTIMAEFLALEDIPPRTETAVGLANYGEAQAIWRDSIESRLPLCQLGFEAGLLMRHIASDSALALALEIAGLAHVAAPVSERIAADRAALATLTEDFADEANALVAAQTLSTPLPACSDREKFGYVLFGLTHPDLLEEIGSATDPAALVDAARAHLEWREGFGANLPACADNLEICWLVYRAASAYFTGYTLDLAGLPRDANRHSQLVMRLDERLNSRTTAVTHAFTDSIIASMDDEDAEETEAAPLPERNLPPCETKKLGMGFFGAIVEYSELTERVDAVENVGDVLEFFEAELAWTERYFDTLPTCAEAVEATRLMFEVLADYSSSFALLVAGADFDDIPYVEGIYRNEALLIDWMQEFTEG